MKMKKLNEVDFRRDAVLTITRLSMEVAKQQLTAQACRCYSVFLAVLAWRSLWLPKQQLLRQSFQLMRF